MKVVIPGGTGQVGSLLARALHTDGHEVVVLSRGAAQVRWRHLPWDARTVGPWAAELEGADVVINLAGRSVNCRYTPANRAEIMRSRVESTRAVGAAIAAAFRPPRIWLQMSTATIYAHRFDAANDEVTGIIGGDEPGVPAGWRFSIDVARAWEAAANEASVSSTRLVLMRAAMVMSPDRGGIFDTLRRLARLGLGGRAGDGRQFISWIHEHDFVRAVHHLIKRVDLSGAVNVASPSPLPNEEFMRELRAATGALLAPPATAWMLELGALAMRTETELLLKSRRVVPRRLLESGFTFRYPEWAVAVRDLAGHRL